MIRRPPAIAMPLAAAVLVFIFDHLTKWLAVRYLMGEPPVTIIPNCFHLIYRTNTGAAFSMLEGNPIVLMVLSTAALAGIVWWFWTTPVEERLVRLCQGFILGGAAGNLIDRYTRGYVVDFVDWHWKDVYHWPTFNIADSAIFVSVIALSVYFMFFAKHPEDDGLSEKPKASATDVPASAKKSIPGSSSGK